VTGAPEWLDELDLHVGAPEAAMGTRVLDPTRWLLVDDDWFEQRDAARVLLRARRADVVASGAVTHAAALEVGERLHAWLVAHAPHVVDDGADDPDPLVRARAAVAEDLCLLAPDDDGTWRLVAGAVCFPSYWRLHEKVGLPLSAVHEPVPGYAGGLAARVDRFLGRLKPGQGVHRRNWSIHDSPDLFVPTHAEASPGPERWLRTEHQTLVRLEDCHEFVIFTIRTQQVPLRVIVHERPDVAAGIAAVVRGWTEAQRAYKGSAIDTHLLAWLGADAG
jgi:hypothetical protein